MCWITVITDDYNTYPNEGIDVLVSDGHNYDVVWYIWSGEYKWMKTNIEEDTADEFKSFVPTKWLELPK